MSRAEAVPIIGAAIHRDPWIENFADPADLYLLTGIDMDWEGGSPSYFPDAKPATGRCRNIPANSAT